MKLRGMKKLLAIGLTLFALTGCANTANQQIDGLNAKLIQLEEENKKLQASVEGLEEQINTLTSENNSLLLEMESLIKKEYTIYTRDVDSWEIVEIEKVKIDKNLSLLDRLKELAKSLSDSQFNGFSIEVQEIKEINGEQIAVINLKDKDGAKETWETNYFQGSTGGQITSTAIEETFLQRDIEEKWVDGIQVLYNGKKHMTDHMTLGNIIYREK